MTHKKQIFALFALVAAFLIFSQTTADAGSYYYDRLNSGQSFGIWPNGIKIWGSRVDTETGFNPLHTMVGDTMFVDGQNVTITYDMLKTWYNALLIGQLTGRIIRVLYDDNTGEIISTIPQE